MPFARSLWCRHSLGTISTSITLWLVSPQCLSSWPHSYQLWWDPGLTLQVYLGLRAANCRRFSGSIQAKESQVTWKPSWPFLEFCCCLTGSKPHQYFQSAKLLYSSLLILVGRKYFSFTSAELKCITVKWKINLKCYQISQILAHDLLTGDFPSSAADLHLTLYFLPLQFLGFEKQISLDIILVLSVTFFISDSLLLEEWLMELVVSFMWFNRSMHCGNISFFPLHGKNPLTGNNVSVLLLYVVC